MIRSCTCKHGGQDKLHGPGKRVFNPFTRNNARWARCTACGAEVLVADQPKPKKKEADQ